LKNLTVSEPDVAYNLLV